MEDLCGVCCLLQGHIQDNHIATKGKKKLRKSAGKKKSSKKFFVTQRGHQ